MFDKKQWTLEHKEQINLGAKRRRDAVREAGLCISCGKNPPKNNSRCQDCLNKNHEPKVQKQRAAALSRWRVRLRQKILDHYGRECICCKETEEVFLCLDHTDSNGKDHRKIIGGGGTLFYKWLVVNNFPIGWRLQTMCYNCNNAKRILGYCPHQQRGEGYAKRINRK